ncbi:single-stranded DNA-binding protein [Chromatium okenii]|jgi:single-strand DNA-binding protein|uniref:single-stranded DNA-binding protein n=1 Tax=Chromatium okenii TaxID=61644 RepID=UPI0026F010AD|nr:single-stranded DNA-binding protein [Chromatium okenii]MBV5310761.1 single-stranded DNA-binding protein [Chromatium okenii]
MANYAHVTLVGHIGKDPTTRTIPSGDTVTSFSIATNAKRGQKEFTTWWSCSCWGKRGEALAQYFKKGDAILVTGEPVMRPYTFEGVEKQALDVDVRDWAFVGNKTDAAPRTAAAPAAASSTSTTHPAAPYGGGIPQWEPDYGDIPF